MTPIDAKAIDNLFPNVRFMGVQLEARIIW